MNTKGINKMNIEWELRSYPQFKNTIIGDLPTMTAYCPETDDELGIEVNLADGGIRIIDPTCRDYYFFGPTRCLWLKEAIRQASEYVEWAWKERLEREEKFKKY